MELFRKLQWRIQDASVLDNIPEFLSEESIKKSYVFSKTMKELRAGININSEPNIKNVEDENADAEPNIDKKPDQNDLRFQHIPGYRQLPCRKSILNVNEQKMCVEALVILQEGTVPKLRNKINTLEKFGPKIKKEQIEYAEMMENKWKEIGFKALNEIDEDLELCYSEYWEKKRNTIYNYPKLYEKIRMMPLVVNDCSAEMNFKLNLIEKGDIPLLAIPSRIGKHKITLQANKLLPSQPSSQKSSVDALNMIKKNTVSEDDIAKDLAQIHDADVVISSSALKCIVDNHPPFNNTWHIPVRVKEHEKINSKGQMIKKKIIYIDKPFPKLTQTAAEKNEWAYKKMLKLFITKGVGYSFPTINKTENVAHKYCSDCINFYTSKCSTSVENLQKSCQKSCSNTTDKSPEFENKCSERSSRTERIIKRNLRKRKISTSSEGSMSSDRMIICETETDSREQSPQELKRTSTTSPINSPLCSPRSNSRQPSDVCMCGKSLRTKAASEVNIEIELNDIKKILSDQELEKSKNACNESIQKTGNEKCRSKIGNIWEEISENFCKEEEKISHWNYDESKKNVTYRLWNLKPKFAQSELMKNDHKEFNVLIRNHIDACDTLPNNVFQPVVIVPKIEYQLDYGAELPTKSGIIRQWLSLFIRPCSNLVRVRIDPETSGLLVAQRCNMTNLSFEAIVYDCNPNKGLDSFYNIVNGLTTCSPGEYLLSHIPTNQSFVELSKAADVTSRNVFNLYHMYEENNTTLVNSAPQWSPLDTNILLPNNISQNIVPGLFKNIKTNFKNQTKKIVKKKTNKKKKKTKKV